MSGGRAQSFAAFAFRGDPGPMSSTVRTRVIASDESDTEEIPTPGKPAEKDFLWLQPRNAETISNTERTFNLMKAHLDRRSKLKRKGDISQGSVKSKSAAAMKRKRGDAKDSDDEEASFEEECDDSDDMCSEFSLSKDLRSKMNNNLQKKSVDSRAARLEKRSNKPLVGTSKRPAKESEDEDEFIDSGSESEDDDDDDESGQESDESDEIDNMRSSKSKKRTGQSGFEDELALTDDLDLDDDWEEQGVGKGEIMQKAKRILNSCLAISAGLRRTLQAWNSSASSALRDTFEKQTEQNELSDCVRLVDINSNGSDSNGNGTSPLITQESVQILCPSLTLKAYQLVGINWLKLLNEHNINGVLADDMGLGKTVQTISFLAWRSIQVSSNGLKKRPHLIVVPASTLANWKNEFDKFCPSFNVLIYHGTPAEKLELRSEIVGSIKRSSIDAIITNYTIFERESNKDDRKFLYSLSFEYLILDEAHCLKNANTSRYAKLNNVHSKHRLLLSGTPVQNDVSELLALLSFLMPNTFSKSDCEVLLAAFQWNLLKDNKQSSRGAETGSKSMKKLRRMLAPFVLRRIKADVLSQLTEKIVEVKKVEMFPSQKQLYSDILLHYANMKRQTELKAAAELEALQLLECKKTKSQKKSSKQSKAAKAEGNGEEGEGDTLSFLSQSTGSVSSESISMLKSSLLSKLTNSESRHLFTVLRKAANHPLLLRIRYRDEKVLGRIARVALAHDHYGANCEYDRVLKELSSLSDFDIHQICCEYPMYLSDLTLPSEALYESPKMHLLRTLLPNLLGEGHKVLIFSQWTRLLDLLELLLTDINIRFQRLDGQTPVRERQMLIDQFNGSSSKSTENVKSESKQSGKQCITIDSDEDDCTDKRPADNGSSNTDEEGFSVFLLSTRAGGLGLNLTAADTVILHDLDFNPENDKQAEDRCHRIGQTRQVTVFKMVTSDTVDEDIYEMGERKRQLSEAVLSSKHGESDTTKMSADDDIGTIGRILQSALQRLQPVAAEASSVGGQQVINVE